MDSTVVSQIARSKTLRRVALYSVGVAIYAVLPAALEDKHGDVNDMPGNVHAVFGLVLGWLLVFRTNSSYARWWEARKLWGALVNVSRNLAIKVADLCRADEAELNKFRIEIVAFAWSLKDHLRNESSLQAVPGFEACHDTPSHVPSYLITRMYEEFGTWKAEGSIDGDELRILDAEARQFLDICGGCERIRNTRVVRSYRTFARQCVFLFLVTFPWGMAHTFGWLTVPLTGIVAYFMMGLETVAEHVEEPFGYDEDDLDLDGLCETIGRTVQEVFDRRLDQKKAPIVTTPAADD